MTSDTADSSYYVLALPDFTRRSLESFHSRRRWLSLWRGLSATMVVFTLALLLAVTIDAFWLSELAPWVGSLTLYGLLGSALLGWCLIPRLKPVDLLSEARQLEQLDPRLREQLLAAVELSEVRAGVVDSMAFRRQLQSHVSQLLRSVDVRQLLPWSLVQRHLSVAGGGLAVLLLLCLIPGLYFPHRIARILMPFADWGRVSSIAILLERPTPHSKLVPRDDMLAITARIDGPRPEKVTLETRRIDSDLNSHSTGDAAATAVKMAAVAITAAPRRFPFQSDRSRFEYLLTAGDELIEYRVQSAGASTPWYRLSTLPRPRVIEFEKHITPPAAANHTGTKASQSDVPATVSVAEHGHLQVLVGSHVELHLRVDQATSQAELSWQASDDSSDPATAGNASAGVFSEGNLSEGNASTGGSATVVDSLAGKPLPLRLGASADQLIVDFTVTRSINYRIHLQSLDSGFTNAFGPTYRIQAVEDLEPEITWLVPQMTSLHAASGDVLKFKNEIVDEFPLSDLTHSIRVNGNQWETQPISADPFTEESLAIRTASAVEWELNLSSLHLKAGDQLELKLTATDRQGQTGESAVVRISVSSTKLAEAPAAGELLRREVSAALERIAQKYSQVNSVLDTLLVAPAADEPASNVPQQLSTALRSTTELQRELTDTAAQVEQAIARSEDALNSQTLTHVGDALLAMSASTQVRLPQLEQMSKLSERRQWSPGLLEVRLQFDADLSLASDLAQHFAAMTTYDVVSRYALQLTQLADAERQLSAMAADTAVTPEQLQRRQQVLTQQLAEVQQAMLEALPLVRQETRPTLQHVAVQLGQQIASAENFASVSRPASTPELAAAMAEQLTQLRMLSRLDKSLPAAMKIAFRRLSELAPPSAYVVDELVRVLRQQLPLDMHWGSTTEQLARRRDLQRAAPQGDRLYATDLGNTLRAVEALHTPTHRDDHTAIESLRDIAEAIEILQVIHHVGQADKLLAELLETERQSHHASQLSWRGARAWEAIEQRFEQAVKNLRTAKLPETIISAVDELRHSPAARQAAKKLTDRNWQIEPPPAVIAELEDVRGTLRPILRELAAHARRARQVLDRYAPTISQLAQQAADKVKQVEQQSTQLAEAIAREEVPDMTARLSQLAAQTEGLQTPVDRVRQALVDRADAQNLLDRQQTQLARQADAAREVVDAVDTRLEQARAGAMPAPSPSQQSAQLHSAAADQADSAAALEQLAEHFKKLEDQPQTPSAQQLAEGVTQLQQQLSELAESETGDAVGDAEADNAETDNAETGTLAASDRYAQAEQLAELAAQDPQAVLEQLERELPTNEPMAEEMSSIARQAAEQALEELQRAEQTQQTLINDIELSDANFKAQKELLLHDLKVTSQAAVRMLDTLTSEAEWTASASKNTVAAERIAKWEQSTKELLEQLRDLDIKQPFEQLSAAASTLQAQLSATQSKLLTSARELAEASFEEFHQSGADLANRRREMRDRQRRIQQESVRDAQALERSQTQRVQQLDGELQQLSAAIQRGEAQLLAVRRADTQQLEQPSKQQSEQPSERQSEKAPLALKVDELERQLELERHVQTATKKLHTALLRRADGARQALEKLNAEQRRALDSVNPTAELSAQLSQQAAETSGRLAKQLEAWQTSVLAPAQATATQLTEAYQGEEQIGRAVAGAADNLSRAARHEQRLQHAEVSARLQQVAEATGQVAAQEVQQAAEQLLLARDEALRQSSPVVQASPAATAAAQQASQLAGSSIQRASDSLQQLLSDGAASASAPSSNASSQGDSPSASPPATSPTAGSPPLDAVQKARLLDELDQQLNSEQNFGQKEDDAQPAPSNSSPSDAPAGTLADAAEQLAKSLSRGRQPAPPTATTPDLGMATQSLNAAVEPQSPVAVRVIEVERRGGQWGELREQAADELIETRRDAIAPRFRKQIEAYFRELAEQGAGGSKE